MALDANYVKDIILDQINTLEYDIREVLKNYKDFYSDFEGEKKERQKLEAFLISKDLKNEYEIWYKENEYK